MVLVETAPADIPQRRAALSRLRNTRENATPLGKVLADRLLERNMLVSEAAKELSVEHQAVTKWLWKPVWPYPEHRKALADFLRLPLAEVESLFLDGGARARTRRVEVTCEHHGGPFKKPRHLVRRTRHHYCSPECSAEARKGRRRPPPLPPNRRRSGRHLRRAEGLRQSPSYRVIADAAHLSERTVRMTLRGDHKPAPFTAYSLERAGALPRKERTSLAEALLSFCYEQRLTSPALARRGGVSAVTVQNIINGRDAHRATIAKLATAMRLSPDDLEALCDPDRFRTPWRTAIRLYAVALMAQARRKGFQPQTIQYLPTRRVVPDIGAILVETLRRHPGADADGIRRRLARMVSKQRGPGRRRTFTVAQEREVHRLLHSGEERSLAAIGRRMGWRLKANGYCKVAVSAYNAGRSRCPNCSPPN